MKKEFIIGLLLGTMLMSATCMRTRTQSQDDMADEAEKQTALMQQQVDQLKRIADALDEINKHSTYNKQQQSVKANNVNELNIGR